MKTTNKAAETTTVPCYGGACYACDATAVGLRDRRREGGDNEPACARHADPTIRVFAACIYCSGRVRRGSLVIDGYNSHASCERRECRN